MEDNTNRYIEKTNKDKVLHALQDIELKALAEIDRICRKHQIDYTLTGGTLLGAIRDSGIIPWDDDIDVMMTRKNYFKFINVVNKELDSNKYHFTSYHLDNTYHSIPGRLFINNTCLAVKNAVKANLDMCVCIDVFILDNVADDKKTRDKNAIKLKNLKCGCYAKWLNANQYNYYNTIPQRVIRQYYKHQSYDSLHKKYDKLVDKYNHTRTKYMADNSMLHNTAYISSQAFDNYVDIDFMGYTFSIAQGIEEILTCYYGKNWAEWLPVEKRGMWHTWEKFSLGKYAKEYDLPENYNEYLENKVTAKRLENMKKVSFEMVNEVSRICNENNLKHYVIGKDMYNKAFNVDEYSNLWTEGVVVAMPRKDYEEFAKVAKNNLDNKYFYQSKETEENYYLPYAKLRLKGSCAREMQLILIKGINQGFWIDIIPLDNASDNPTVARNHTKKMCKQLKRLKIKWTYSMTRWLKMNRKNKLIRLLTCFHSIDSLYEKYNNLATKFNNKETNYYYDSTKLFIKNDMIPKELFGQGVMLEFINNYEVRFPSEYKKLTNEILNKKELHRQNTRLDLKENNYEKYKKEINNPSENRLNIISEKVTSISLGIYDCPEYILSCSKEAQDIEKRDKRIQYIKEEIKKQTQNI